MTQPTRRTFVGLSLAALMTGVAEASLRRSLTGAQGEIPGSATAGAATELLRGLPRQPAEKSLDWQALAEEFDRYVMDPSHNVYRTRKDGSRYFASALEGKSDGGLTAFGPMTLGKALRSQDVSRLAPSLRSYFSEEFGLFLDGPGAVLCEYWYLMNVNALAFGLIRTSLAAQDGAAQDGAAQDGAAQDGWKTLVRRSADALIVMARKIDYNFNDQGFNFAKGAAFTNQDIYRQPDAVGGYAYVLLLAAEMLGEQKYRDEAQGGMRRYAAFAQNPWYEVPSGAMACLAAARLGLHRDDAQLRRALGFVFDEKAGLMYSGKWNGSEVNGLMAGFRTEPPKQAYSMESMVVLPYVLPVVRYRPEFAADIGRYALNLSSNMRWFFPDYLPKENQSRPDLPSMVPYERLSLEEKGHSPYATGDFDGHRSVYGGAYMLWLAELIRPTGDPYILQLNAGKTDFLAEAVHPTYLYYNSYDREKTIELDVASGAKPGLKSGLKSGLEAGPVDIYDVAAHRMMSKGVSGTVAIPIPAGEARVLVLVPSGQKRTSESGVIKYGGIAVDFNG